MVDLLELCGGSGGISQLAFSRGLSSGGNLDKRSYVDPGNKDVQDAVMHYQCCHTTTQLQNDWTTFIFLGLRHTADPLRGFLYVCRDLADRFSEASGSEFWSHLGAVSEPL
eukprot:448424-Pyramimonas_sp.AAC.2